MVYTVVKMLNQERFISSKQPFISSKHYYSFPFTFSKPVIFLGGGKENENILLKLTSYNN